MTILETLSLEPKPPYDIESHFEAYLGKKPQPQIYVDGTYRRNIRACGKLVPFEVDLNNDLENPELGVSIYSDLTGGELEEFLEKIRWVFNTEFDLDSMYKFMKKEPSLKTLKDEHYGLRPERCPTFYEALVKAIIEQQISLQVAKEMIWQVVKKFGLSVNMEDKQFWAFPTSDKLSGAEVNEIKDCKLSRRKAEYIKNISELISTCELDMESLKGLRKDKIIQRLVKIRGIGRWTAEMAVVRYFGAGKINPAGDLGVRKAMSNHFDGEERMSEEEVREHTKEWGDYKGLITYYLLADSKD